MGDGQRAGARLEVEEQVRPDRAQPHRGLGDQGGPVGLRQADAHAVLEATVKPGKLQSLGLFLSCTYTTAKFVTLTVQTRSMSRADFVKSAKANPGPVKPVGGIGAVAYSAGGGVTLLVWRRGSEATFSIYGAGPALAREITLAKRVVPRL